MSKVLLLNQLDQLANPDARLVLGEPNPEITLERYAHCYAGILSGDSARFIRIFCELPSIGAGWDRLQTTVEDTEFFGGNEHVFLWEDGKGAFSEFIASLDGRLGGAWRRGGSAWGRRGVTVSSMRDLPVTLYTGCLFDNNSAVTIPNEDEHLPAIWCFCSSPEFNKAVRAIDQKLNVTNATLVKVPFDLEYWEEVARQRYPDGLPEPHSDDPTQWLFRGDIPSSTEPLQVAMARLLGYRWPEQVEDGLDEYVDEDGIVTLSPMVGQEGVANRLREILQAAHDSPQPARPKGAPEIEVERTWHASTLSRLLTEAGAPGMPLEEWLRDRFFEAHCKLFHQRPFIWHIWDGRKDGFHAFVNYHKLDGRNLDRLTHVYLGDWIERQRRATGDDPTAEGRLAAALQLQKKLEQIRIGEPPLDIYVRWKPLHEQPIGWEPDLNDGVRLNIRPFVTAGVLRGKVGVKWDKDRGKDPKPNVSGTVDRLNDLHFTLAEKRAAREAASA